MHRMSDVGSFVGILKRTVLKLPFGTLLFAAVRDVYVRLYTLFSRALKTYVAIAHIGKKAHYFRWQGWCIVEPKGSVYHAGKILNGLSGYVRTVDMLRAALADDPAPVIVDAGANIGIYSLLYSRIPGARVFAFEPVTHTYGMLMTNVVTNAIMNVEPIALGLSDHAGNIYIGSETADRKPTCWSVHVANDGTGEEARFTTLDLFCVDRGIGRLALIKIDVQGHERAVLAGAEKIIRACRPILVVESVNGRQDPEGTLSMLENWGYRLFGWNGVRLRPVTSSEWPAAKNIEPDIYCFPEHRSPPDCYR